MHMVHAYVCVCACGVACMHQSCAAVQIEILQGQEVAEALQQLNLNVQAGGAHAGVCECAHTCVCLCLCAGRCCVGN